ncbi:MAG: preprotein translocase, SecA subunit, partial [Fibrobacterota bacterium]
IFGGQNIRGMMDRLGAKEGEVITHPLLNRSIAGAQKRVEAQNFEVRKHLLEYDDVMNQQRKVVYSLRRRILLGENVRDEIVNRLSDAADLKISTLLSVRGEEEVDHEDGSRNWEAASAELHRSLGVNCDLALAHQMGTQREALVEDVSNQLEAAYASLEEQLGSDLLRELERQLLLLTIDHLWKSHLYDMDNLKEAIRYRGYGQKDPLSEYKQEGFSMFQGMLERLALEVAERILHIDPAAFVMPTMPSGSMELEMNHPSFAGLEEEDEEEDEAEKGPAPAPLLPGTRPVMASTPQASRPVPLPSNVSMSIGRNDVCPCGSGKKFKKCHGA